MKKLLFVLMLVFIAFPFSFSQDGNNAWTQNGANLGRIYCGVINPANQSIIYVAGLDSGVYKTINGGLNWVAVNNGLVYKKVQCLAIAPSNPNILYAGTDSLGGANSGVYKTTDAGASWVFMMSGMTDLAVQSLVVHTTNPNIVWACSFNGVGPAAVGLWKTTNGGTNWFVSNTGIASDNKNVLSIAINPLNPNVLYVGTSLILPASTGPPKIYKTYDGGANWNLMSTGLPALTTDNNPIRCLEVLKSDTSRVGAALFVNSSLTGGFFLSTNGGQLWTKKHSGLPEVSGSLLRSMSMRSANEFYVGMDGGTTTKGVWRTTNGGNNWAEFNNTVMTNTHPVRMLLFKTTGDTTLYAGAAGTTVPLTGVYEYTWSAPPAQRVWSEQISGLYIYFYTVSAVDNNVAWVCGDAGKVVRTTNKGVAWTNVSGNLPVTSDMYCIYGFDANNAIVTGGPAAGTFVWKTVNGGVNWTQTFAETGGFMDGFYFLNATTGFMYGDPVAPSTRWSLWKTVNAGANWDSTGLYVPSGGTYGTNNSMFGLGNDIWFGGGTSALPHSSNAGVTWANQTLPGTGCTAIWFNSPAVGLSDGGLTSFAVTTNGGTNWTNLNSTAISIASITGEGSEWWFVGYSGGVNYSTNIGANWSQQYPLPGTGGTYTHITKSRTGNTLWAVRTNGGISRYGDPITGVTPVSATVPDNYSLSQNYPNPFNPVTKINFAIPKSGLVTLKIYDILGREVKTLVNEVKAPGNYAIEFNGSELTSGVYFCRMQSADFNDVKKLVLLK
ncbi:MAG: T9SS type A sorting domain-containing protein [Ignavibacteriae bacterium]|nr:T9SS type A sorting domain-containing protein [Ignavibacteriota bacterium]